MGRVPDVSETCAQGVPAQDRHDEWCRYPREESDDPVLVARVGEGMQPLLHRGYCPHKVDSTGYNETVFG